jgi:hypothetical protein
VSLDYLFQSSHRHYGGLLPSLNDRLALAAILARCVTSLHACGWVHKSICPRNVIFFYPEGHSSLGAEALSLPPGFLRRPYLNGYAYSRRNENTGSSGRAHETYASLPESIVTNDATDFYRHPATFGPGDSRAVFKKTYDLYSLGILLLEIALWRTCRPENEDVHPKQVRKMLSRKYLKGQLAYRVGTTYEEVVRTCLMGSFGEEKSEKSWLEIEVMRTVVQRLESSRV